MIGCSEGDTECEDSEKPVHKVKITKSFYMGKYEVTQGAVMGNNPSYFVGANCDMPTGCDNHPVEQVSWNDVKSFLVKLNAQEGRTGARMYRLLAEAEWEYAARAGDGTRVVELADQALYAAKRNGRNRVEVSTAD